jgi:hypothetical protein
VCSVGFTRTGLIPESKWAFRSCSQVLGSNYHLEIIADSFKDWVLNRFLSYVEGLISNTNYHSVVKDKLLIAHVETLQSGYKYVL